LSTMTTRLPWSNRATSGQCTNLRHHQQRRHHRSNGGLQPHAPHRSRVNPFWIDWGRRKRRNLRALRLHLLCCHEWVQRDEARRNPQKASHQGNGSQRHMNFLPKRRNRRLARVLPPPLPNRSFRRQGTPRIRQGSGHRYRKGDQWRQREQQHPVVQRQCECQQMLRLSCAFF
jgi:hypothetical protein